MRKLAKPAYKAKDVLEVCADNIRDQVKKAALSAVANSIAAAEIRYDRLGPRARLYLLQGTDGIGADVSTADMVWLYDNKLSKKNEKARKTYYDEIKSAPKYGTCPLCAHRDVGTLDHYLAKTIHPLYAITPINLVPACNQCNKTKATHQPTSADKQTLHPYFDDVDQAQWLKAKVVEKKPPGILFFAEPPNHWPQVLRERVVEHFRLFGLEELYAPNAARSLANIGRYLRETADCAGANGVHQHLEKLAISYRAAEINSWETAMYEAMAASQWFWGGGHRDIPV